MAIAYVAALALQVVVNGLAGRALGTDGFGTFASSMTVAIIASQVGLLGYQTIALRDATRLRQHSCRKLEQESFAAMRSLDRIILPILGSVCGLALVAWRHPGGSQSVMLVFGTAVLIAIGAQQRMHAGYLRGFGDVKVSGFLEGRSGGAIMLGCQALAILLAMMLSGGRSPYLLILASGLAVLPSAFFSRRLVSRHFGRPPRWAPMHDLFDTIRRSRGFAALQAGTLLDVNLDVVVAALVLSQADSSLFASAQRVAMIIVMPTALAQMALGPLFARSRNDPAKVESVARSAATLTTVMSAVAMVPICIAPGWLLDKVYGDGFGSGAAVLVLMAVGYFLRVTAGMATAWMSMTGHERTAVRIYWLGNVARALVGSAAGLAFGTVAFAVVSVVVTSVVFWTLWWRARVDSGIRTHPRLVPDLRALRQASS